MYSIPSQATQHDVHRSEYHADGQLLSIISARKGQTRFGIGRMRIMLLDNPPLSARPTASEQ